MYHRLMNVSQIVHCSHEIHSVNTKFQKIVYHPSQFTVHRKWDPPQKIYKVPYSGIRSYNPAPARLAGPRRPPGRGGAAPMPHDGAVGRWRPLRRGRRRLEGGGSAPRATAATRGRRRLEGGCGDPGPVPAATLGKDFGTAPGRPNVSWRRVGATNGVGG